MASIGTEYKDKLDDRFLNALFNFINENTDKVVLLPVLAKNDELILYHNEDEVKLKKEVVKEKLIEVTTLDLDKNFEITIIFKRK